jgi:hypothetical protein
MKKIGTLAFLAASLFAAHLALANPLPAPTGGWSSGGATSTGGSPLPAPSGGMSGSGGATSTGGSDSGSGGKTAIGGLGGSGSGTDSSSDSGCSLAGSHLARSLAPWLIASAFSVAYFFVRRRPRR